MISLAIILPDTRLRNIGASGIAERDSGIALHAPEIFKSRLLLEDDMIDERRPVIMRKSPLMKPRESRDLHSTTRRQTYNSIRRQTHSLTWGKTSAPIAEA